MLLAHWRYALSQVLQLVAAAAASLFLGTILYIAVRVLIDLPTIIRDYGRYSRGEMGFVDGAFFEMGQDIMIWAPVMLYAGLYLLPLVLTLPVAAPVIALWDRPPRVLLLRPFHRGRLSRPLRKIMRRDVGRYGHVYTLSDTDMKVPWYVRIPLLFGQLALFSFRARKIRDAKQIRRLERATERTWLRNTNWCLSFSKVFPVATSDEYWQRVVTSLLARANAVIIDITNVSENVRWEIDRAHEGAGDSHVLYLVASDHAPDATARLSRILGDESVVDRVFAYEGYRVVERDRFMKTLARAVTPSMDDHRAGRGVAVAAIVAFGVGLIPLLALAFPGPLGLPRWTPWDHPAIWPGLSAVVNPAALAVLAFGVATWLLLVIGARRLSTMWFVVVVQTLVLAASPIGMLDW